MRRLGISPAAGAGLILLLGINLWLLKIVTAEVLSEDASLGDKVTWNANLTAAAAVAAKQKPIDAYRAIVDQPVFSKSRAPYVAPPPPPPIAVAPPPPPIPVDPGLALGGVMLKNDIRKIYVFSRSGTNGAWIREGEDFMGWKVIDISKGGAKLEQAGRSIELELYPR